MGVKGLWKLIGTSGVPVRLENLEHQILAIDISIWLHQGIHGFRNSSTNPGSAHLLTLFHRICKLLFYKIRPVFVFDGGVPLLKKKTLAARRIRREMASSHINKVREHLLTNLLKMRAVKKALGKGHNESHLKPDQEKQQKDLFELPPLVSVDGGILNKASSDEAIVKSEISIYNQVHHKDVHNFNFDDPEFSVLPLELKHEVLCELQETRKENSWSTINEMPEELPDFSDFQMKRLLKRAKFQDALDGIREKIKENRAADLEAQLFGELEKHVSITNRIISEDDAHSILVKDINKTLDNNINTKDDHDIKSKKGNCDFLNELAGRDLLQQSDESDPDEDDISLPFHENHVSSKTVLDEIRNSLLSDGLTQNEILALIEQSEAEVNSDGRTYDQQPGTSSAVSLPCVESEGSLSDDDDDFIEVFNTEAIVQDSGRKNYENYHEMTDNLTKVLETKSDSLYLKIVQQKLDDVCCEKTSENISCSDTQINSDESSEVVLEIPSKGSSEQANLGSLSVSDYSASSEKTILDCGIVDVSCDHKKQRLDVLERLRKEKDTFRQSENAFSKAKDDQSVSQIDFGTTQPLANSIDYTSGDQMEVSKIVEKNSDYPKKSCSGELMIGSSDTCYDKNTEIKHNKLIELEERLEVEKEMLIGETERSERILPTLNEGICSDAQELLHLFGIPYVLAPMEAEAQCAYLELAGLCHGTITDDSDVLLFGASKVYKNFFTQAKVVKLFKSSDIQKEFGLNRTKLVLLAYLTGSDYTEGIESIGIVSAMEILSEFDGEGLDCLYNLKRWWESAQENMSAHSDSKVKQFLTNVNLPESFPNKNIFKAYIDPEVDTSTEKFCWGLPKMDELCSFASVKFGWNKNKCDEILLPIMERMGVKGMQMKIDKYFTKVKFQESPRNHFSKRLNSAILKMRDIETDDIGNKGDSVVADKRKGRKPKPVDTTETLEKKSDKLFSSGKGKKNGLVNAECDGSFLDNEREKILNKCNKRVKISHRTHNEMIPQRERSSDIMAERKKNAKEVLKKCK